LCRVKDLYGTAEPAIAGDELDVTLKNPSVVPKAMDGLSFSTKLFYASLIIGLCVVFIKTRKNGNMMKAYP